MADQLNMGGLNLGDGQQGGRSYIPPHMRRQGGGPPPMNGPAPNGPVPNGPAPGGPAPGGPAPAPGPNGIGNSAWAKYVFYSSAV